MLVITGNRTEQVIAQRHIGKGIRPDANAVVGTVAHSAILNRNVYVAQGFGDVQVSRMGTGS